MRSSVKALCRTSGSHTYTQAHTSWCSKACSHICSLHTTLVNSWLGLHYHVSSSYHPLHQLQTQFTPHSPPSLYQSQHGPWLPLLGPHSSSVFYSLAALSNGVGFSTMSLPAPTQHTSCKTQEETLKQKQRCCHIASSFLACSRPNVKFRLGLQKYVCCC